MVLAQHALHLLLVLGAHDDAVVGVVGRFHEVQEAVCAVAVVSRVGEEAVMAVQEDHGVPGFEEIFGGGGAAGAGGKVVDEAHGLVLEGDGGPAGCDEDDSTVR